MTTPTRFAQSHPRWTLILALLVTLGGAAGGLRLELRTDGLALVPPDDPALLDDAAIRDRFDLGSPLVLEISPSPPGDALNPAALALLAALTDSLRSMPSIDSANVISLATERGTRFVPGSLIQRFLLDPLPATPAECERLRAEVRGIGLYHGTLISRDEQALAIRVDLPAQTNRLPLLRELRQLCDRLVTPGHRIDILGAPAAEAILGAHVLRDLGLPSGLAGPELIADASGGLRPGLLPLAFLVLAGVFLVAFRSGAAVALPVGEAIAAVAFVLGAMGWMGVPVYLTTAVLPVLLVAIAITDEVHLYARFAQWRRTLNGRQATALTLDEMTRPIVLTSITTAVGFLSFALSPISPVRAFGLFTALGIVFCLVWSLTVIPAALILWDPRVRHTEAPPRTPRIPTRWLLGFTLTLLALAPFGIARVTVQDSWIDGFAEGSPFRVATDLFNERFLGMHMLLLRLDETPVDVQLTLPARNLGPRDVTIPTGAIPWDRLPGCEVEITREPDPHRATAVYPDRWLSTVAEVARQGDSLRVTFRRQDGSPRFMWRPGADDPLDLRMTSQSFLAPEPLARMDTLARRIEEGDATVGGVLGPPEYLRTTRSILHDLDPRERRLPETNREAAALWGHYTRVRGPDRVREVVSEDYRSGLLAVFLKHANYRDTERLMSRITTDADSLLPEFTLRFGGDVAVSQSLIRAITTTQVRSLLASLLGVLIIASLLTRSLRWGLLTTLPCAMGVTLTFGGMGLLGIHLGVATSMFAGMTLGFGIDFAIHMVDRARGAAGRGASPDDAVAESLRITGPPIRVSAAAMVLGLGVLLVSEVPANARLGAVTAFSVLGCAGATFGLLPPLMKRLLRREQGDA